MVVFSQEQSSHQCSAESFGSSNALQSTAENWEGAAGNLARFFPFYWIQVNCGEAAATARAIHSAAFEETLLLLYASKQIPMICTF